MTPLLVWSLLQTESGTLQPADSGATTSTSHRFREVRFDATAFNGGNNDQAWGPTGSPVAVTNALQFAGFVNNHCSGKVKTILSHTATVEIKVEKGCHQPAPNKHFKVTMPEGPNAPVTCHLSCEDCSPVATASALGDPAAMKRKCEAAVDETFHAVSRANQVQKYEQDLQAHHDRVRALKDELNRVKKELKAAEEARSTTFSAYANYRDMDKKAKKKEKDYDTNLQKLKLALDAAEEDYEAAKRHEDHALNELQREQRGKPKDPTKA